MRFLKYTGLLVLLAALSACGGSPRPGDTAVNPAIDGLRDDDPMVLAANGGGRLSDLFGNNTNPNTTIAVNKYLWNASLEILNFLPIQSVDPFSGVIITGFGTPPGGGRAYRATILVQDPALDARSLKVALVSQAGVVDPATVRAVEDAILTRARQLRIRDGNL